MKRTYGNEKTNLTLSGKALDFYNMTDPITIIEEEQNDSELLYQVLSETEPMHDGLMTEEKLIRWLEDGYDDLPAESKTWYAVQINREDDWGNGSYDLDEAIAMARKQQETYRETLIAVVKNDECIDEIAEF